MSMNRHEDPTLLGTFRGWWRNSVMSRAAAAEIDRLDSRDVGELARDLGLTASDLRSISRKSSISAELLAQRMSALRLDPEIVASAEPAVLRDMQRVCMMCSAQRRCREELGQNSASYEWRNYCLNRETLDALDIERAIRRLARTPGK